MQVLRRAAVVAALALPMAATPASAQKYHFDFGVDGGYSWYSKSLGVVFTDYRGLKVKEIQQLRRDVRAFRIRPARALSSLRDGGGNRSHFGRKTRSGAGIENGEPHGLAER